MTVAPTSRRKAFWRELLQQRRAVIGGVLLLIITLLAIFAPLIAPHDPIVGDVVNRYQPPSSTYWMGTDGFGRDVLSRCLWAGRVSLLIGVSVVAISTVVSLIIGLIAGLRGGWVDALLMRAADVLMVFPTLFLLITIVAVFGSGIGVLVIVLALTSWDAGARLIRGEVLAIRTREYITAAYVLGASMLKVGVSHVVPAVLPIVIVTATVRVPFTILLEASLSFLGMGVQPPTPSWGNMIGDSQAVLTTAWWTSIFPGLFIVATVLGFNLLGDGLRDAADPHSRTIEAQT